MPRKPRPAKRPPEPPSHFRPHPWHGLAPGPGPPGLLHAFILTHFLNMVVFAPYDYENRLAMPMYVAMVPISAAGLQAILAALAALARPAGGRLDGRRRRDDALARAAE